MKHQTNAPKFCLFLLLCLFSYSAVTAKAENKKIAKKLNTSEIEIEEMTRNLYNKIQIGEAVQEDVNLLNLQPDFLYN